MIMLIDREDEMKTLLEIEKSTKAELVLVYGRRRVGKSRLLVEFAKKENAYTCLRTCQKTYSRYLPSRQGKIL